MGARGRVLPMSCEPLDIVAEVAGPGRGPDARRAGSAVRSRWPARSGRSAAVALDPADATACPEALAAIDAGRPDHPRPGFLVHQRAAAPDAARHGRRHHRAAGPDRLVVLNLAAQPGETEGFSPEQHLDVLSAHAPNLRVDSVLADRACGGLPQRLASAAARLGARLDLHDVASPAPPARPEPAVGVPGRGAGGRSRTGGPERVACRATRQASRERGIVDGQQCPLGTQDVPGDWQQ